MAGVPADFDPWGGVQIKCGSGFSADLVQATFAGKADQCQHALAVRRMWAIPVAALGWLIVIVLVVPLLRPQERARQADDCQLPRSTRFAMTNCK